MEAIILFSRRFSKSSHNLLLLNNSNSILDILKFLSKYGIYLFLILFGAYSIYDGLTKKKINISDLYAIEGTLSNYNFEVKNGGFKKPKTYHYYLWLNEFPCTFQIPADFISHFSEKEFKNNTLKGGKYILKISFKDSSSLKLSNKKIRIYSLSQERLNYLYPSFSLNKENSKNDIYLGTFIILLSSIFLFFKIKREKQPPYSS